MAKRKTEYVMLFNANPADVNTIVVNWLRANGFTLMEKYNTKFYRKGDGFFTAYKCFEYQIMGNELKIWGYLKSPKKPFPLDNGYRGSFDTVPYANSIQELMQTVNGLSNTNVNTLKNPEEGVQSGISQVSVNQEYINKSMESFAEDMDSKMGKLSNVALGISIFSLVLSFFGVLIGIIFIGYGYYLGISTLKSSSKSKSVISLVFLSLSLVIIVFEIIFSYM